MLILKSVSVGWSEWENWTTCPVTCGAGQQVSVRHCRDKEKYQESLHPSRLLHIIEFDVNCMHFLTTNISEVNMNNYSGHHVQEGQSEEEAALRHGKVRVRVPADVRGRRSHGSGGQVPRAEQDQGSGNLRIQLHRSQLTHRL